ncbi:Por secretion system C-terminal sorting domain-containing protein [Dyadobacter soli]|uniref:Por secretion system C-terminal sorting domain-containing protein n=1 Tax=Dyadobacter soli TaxID=659014 RepID=A0A1G7RFY6_9BACT|nr:T9SS type A sorting domain-containing protein [Dyadobacter soli]SDG09049.1 Por secretion system C-terminal sorting domain-containing protein [Dyadobacter soli]
MRKLLLLLLLVSLKSFGQTLETDRLALVAIYNGISGPNNHPEFENWVVPGNTGDSPCGWNGVTCESGRVTKLNLRHSGIRGTLAPEVGNLTALTTLDLTGVGAELGAWAGELPATIGNLTNLEYLYLSENRFGTANMGVIGNLTKLKGLSLTPLGPIPSQLANLVNLETLYLGADEALGGGIPSEFPVFLTTLPKLKELYLIQQVTGTLPAEIGNLSNLEVLVLDRNFSMDAHLPTGIGNLSNLTRLKISQLNSISDLGPIPFDLENFPDLEELEISGSPYSGALPADLWNLTKLQKLKIGSTNMNGPVPAAISNLPNLTHLDLAGNAFSGPLPSLSNIPVSGFVDLQFNAFTFAGLEENISKLDLYVVQAKIPVYAQFVSGGAKLYAQVGGTLANNTYKWFKNNVLFATNIGDSTLTVTEEAAYRVEVTNSVVTGLTLSSNGYSYVKLPVTLVSFNGKSVNNQTKLAWKTTSETSNKGFEIERSADARTFEKIGFVDGSGDTKENQFYHFTDLNPLATGYYRLKQLDYDGKFEHSKVIVVRAGEGIVKMYPNPAQTELTVEGAAENEPVSVFTSAGRPVVTGAKLSGGKFDVTDLKEGIYTIKIGDVAKKLLIKR